MALIEYVTRDTKEYADGSKEVRIVTYTGLRALVEYVEDCREERYL